MEEKQAERLADFLTNLHDANKNRIQTKQALAKYVSIMESPMSKRVCSINYSRDIKSILKGKLLSFFRAPTGRTAILLAQVDEKHEWVKLIRFVAKKGGDFNAETISLTGKAVQGFNGFGYRYEHPEDAGDEHNYFHIQPISEASGGELIPGLPNWFPYRFPTFYMNASNSYELSIYAISSICGWKDLQRFQNIAQDDCWLLNHLISKGREAFAREASAQELQQ
jgi:hypothetical protein